jgi:hypothetical protein
VNYFWRSFALEEGPEATLLTTAGRRVFRYSRETLDYGIGSMRFALGWVEDPARQEYTVGNA